MRYHSHNLAPTGMLDSPCAFQTTSHANTARQLRDTQPVMHSRMSQGECTCHMCHTVTDVRTGKHFSRKCHAYLLVTTAHCESKEALLFCTWGHTMTGVRTGKKPYCSAHGALVAVVPSSEKAVPAEGVATGGGHRLVQQLQTQYALKLIHSLCHSWPVAPRLYSVDKSDVKHAGHVAR